MRNTKFVMALVPALLGLISSMAAAQPVRGFKIAVAEGAPMEVQAAAKQVLAAANAAEPPAILKVLGANGKPTRLSDTTEILNGKLPERAYNHLVLVGLPNDPLITAAWQREARLENGGFYVFGWGHLKGDIGYIESGPNPFLHSATISTAPFETEVITLTGSTPRGVQLAVDAFLKQGLLNGVVAGPGWTRPKTSLLDRDPVPPGIPFPANIGESALLGVTAGGEDEVRGVLADAGTAPAQIWRAKYFVANDWDGKGAAAAFDNFSYGLHRRAYGNTVWAAQFNSEQDAKAAAPKMAGAAKLRKTGSVWAGELPPYADKGYSGDRPSAGPLSLWQHGNIVIMSTLPATTTEALRKMEAWAP